MNKSYKFISAPCAIIIGLDSMQGLQTARILAKRGVPVVSIAKDPKYHACRTRVCKDIVYANTENYDLIEVLKNLGKKLSKKAVLYPCQDNNVMLVSQYRNELENYYHIIMPSHEVVEMLINRGRVIACVSWMKMMVKEMRSSGDMTVMMTPGTPTAINVISLKPKLTWNKQVKKI